MSRLPDLIEFSALKRAPKPNNCLVLPEGFLSASTPDRASPAVAMAPRAVFDRVMDEVLRREEWRLKASDPDTLQVSFVAVTKLMKFKDDVYVQAVPAGGQAGHSQVAVYSRSRIGYSDLGTNARRVDEILALLGA